LTLAILVFHQRTHGAACFALFWMCTSSCSQLLKPGIFNTSPVLIIAAILNVPGKRRPVVHFKLSKRSESLQQRSLVSSF